MSKAESTGPLAADDGVPGTDLQEGLAPPPASRILDRAQPVWRTVLVLALPVLAQQFLVLSVGLSDRLLAGRMQPLPKREQAEALGHELMRLGFLGGGCLSGRAFLVR